MKTAENVYFCYICLDKMGMFSKISELGKIVLRIFNYPIQHQSFDTFNHSVELCYVQRRKIVILVLERAKKMALFWWWEVTIPLKICSKTPLNCHYIEKQPK